MRSAARTQTRPETTGRWYCYQSCVEALFRDGKIVGFEGSHVSSDAFLNIRERGFLRFPLAQATGQAGAFGDPEAVFASIDQHLSHTFILSDFLDACCGPSTAKVPQRASQ